MHIFSLRNTCGGGAAEVKFIYTARVLKFLEITGLVIDVNHDMSLQVTYHGCQYGSIFKLCKSTQSSYLLSTKLLKDLLKMLGRAFHLIFETNDC